MFRVRYVFSGTFDDACTTAFKNKMGQQGHPKGSRSHHFVRFQEQLLPGWLQDTGTSCRRLSAGYRGFLWEAGIWLHWAFGTYRMAKT